VLKKTLANSNGAGGPGIVVKIDESFQTQAKGKCIGLNQSNTECVTPIFCIYLPQNHRGRAPANEYWVFGMIDTSVTPALGVVRAVRNHSAATLLPIIQQNVAPGTIVWSDE